MAEAAEEGLERRARGMLGRGAAPGASEDEEEAWSEGGLAPDDGDLSAALDAASGMRFKVFDAAPPGAGARQPRNAPEGASQGSRPLDRARRVSGPRSVRGGK